jgi:hypothetical protein
MEAAAKHLKKYVDSFGDDTKADWKTCVNGQLKELMEQSLAQL